MLELTWKIYLGVFVHRNLSTLKYNLSILDFNNVLPYLKGTKPRIYRHKRLSVLVKQSEHEVAMQLSKVEDFPIITLVIYVILRQKFKVWLDMC